MTRQSEKRDVDAAALAFVGLMLVISLILSTLATALLYRSFSIERQLEVGPLSVPMPKTETPFPDPQLQIYPTEDMEKFRREEDGILGSYRWIDKKTGVIGIPVQRAMELLAGEKKEPILGTPGLPPGPTWTEMMQRRAQEGAAERKERVQP